MNRVYKFEYNGRSWKTYGNNREDAIYQFHRKYGFPEDFIKQHFKIKRIYEVIK